MSANVLTLKESINNLLNSREQAEFVDTINEYHQERNVVLFCGRLHGLLDTPAKLQLATLVRRVIPRSDLAVFEELMTTSLDGARTLQSRKYLTARPAKGGHQPRHGQHHHQQHHPHRTHHKPKGPGSTVSLPARLFNTLPSKSSAGNRIVMRPSLERSYNSRPELPAWEPGIVSNVKKIYIEQIGANKSLGFSIRGGAEHGIGIYVSYVDVDSVAERQGLVPGDQILSINGLSFRKLTHHEAVKLIKGHRSLEVEVRNVGRVPGSFETHQTYTWVNPTGRTVSPPPEVDRTSRYKNAGQRKSGLMLLKDSDERKVNLVVHDTKKLGIMIRGGNDFGLGIYVTGVDQGSVVENGGLKMGDQVLDVNGTSFLDISHNEAVKVLKSSRHLIMTVKDVGKLPYAKTTYDHTKWIMGTNIPGRTNPRNSSFGRGLPGLPDLSASSTSVFSRGAGSQLMHTSMLSQRSQWTLLEDQSKQLLNDNERATINYYITEYEHDNVTVSSLVLALLELLNTRAKMSLMVDIRGLIAPRDLEKFDTMLIQRNAMTMRSRSVDALMTFNDQMSETSLDTSSMNNSQHSGITSSAMNGDEMEPLREALSQICEDREITWHNQTHKVESPITLNTPVPPPVPPKAYTTADIHHVKAEVHPPYLQQQMRIKKLCEEDMRSPSEDSGVDISLLETSVSSGSQGNHSHLHGNGSHGHHNGVNGQRSQRHTSQHHYHDNYAPDHNGQMSGYGNHLAVQGNPRVKMSTAEPIIINDVLREKASNGLAYYHSDGDSTARSTVPPDLPLRPVQEQRPLKRTAPPPPPRHASALSPAHGYHRHIETAAPASRRPPQQRNLSPGGHQHELPEPAPYGQYAAPYPSEQPGEGPYGQYAAPYPSEQPGAGPYGQHAAPYPSEQPGAGRPGLTPEEDALRGFDEILGVSPPSPPDLSYPGLLAVRHRDGPDHALAPVEESHYRETLDLPPPLQFAGSREPSPSRELTSLQVAPAVSPQPSPAPSSGSAERRPSGHPGHNGHSGAADREVVVNGIPVAALPSGAGYGSLRERVKSRRAALAAAGDTNTYLQPRAPAVQTAAHWSGPPAASSPQGDGHWSSSPPTSSTHADAHWSSSPSPSTAHAHALWSNSSSATSSTQADVNRPTSYAPAAKHPPGERQEQGARGEQAEHIRVVRMTKARPTLGIAIGGGANTKQPMPRIITIQPSGCAISCPDIKVGQILLEVDGHSLHGLSHKDCAKTIAQAFKDRSRDYLEFTVLDSSVQLAA